MLRQSLLCLSDLPNLCRERIQVQRAQNGSQMLQLVVLDQVNLLMDRIEEGEELGSEIGLPVARLD